MPLSDDYGDISSSGSWDERPRETFQIPGRDHHHDDDLGTRTTPSASARPGLTVSLPRTVKELKRRSTDRIIAPTPGHGDKFEYRRWCLFVPDPLWRPGTGKDNSVSRFIRERSKGFAGMLGEATLFVTLVNKDGSVDLHKAGEIMRALGLKRGDMPLLLISNMADLHFQPGRKKRLNFTAGDDLDLVIVKFGGSTLAEVEATLGLLAQYMADDDGDVPATELSLSRFAIRLTLAAKKIAKLAPVVLAIWTKK